MTETKVKKARLLVGDAFSFVKSMEANKALAEVTLDDLLVELIKRNGESSKSNENRYNPYSYTAGANKPSEMTTVSEYGPAGNPISGTPFNNPTKLDRLLALKQEVRATIADIKKEAPDDADYEDAGSDIISPN